MELLVGVISISVDAVVVVDSSFSPQEKMTKLKIMERIMRIYLKELPVSVLMRDLTLTSMGLLCKNRRRLWSPSDSVRD